MDKVIKPYSSGIIVISAILLFLSACGKAASASPSVGVLSVADGKSAAAGIALEQENGYDAGFKVVDTQFDIEPVDEGAPQSDIQRTIRDMVQGKVKDKDVPPLLALLGATSNEATSHAAALVNFFNVPMLIPSANGDNLFPSNNLWAFRLSAPGAAYANYLFGKVVTKQAMDAISIKPSDSVFGDPPQLKVAILYERNTFGESAAVATATAVMAQSVSIRVYDNFKPDNTDPESLKTLAKKVKDAGAQLVYLISSDPALAKNLTQTLRAVFDSRSMPIMVGQAEGFAARDFVDSKESEGVYVLRQKIDHKSCPPGVKSIYDAQSYAAVYLLDYALQQANENLSGIVKQFSLGGKSGSAIQQQREALRDALKQINVNAPCLGKVAFDNTGQNKLLNLELIRIIKGVEVDATTENFLNVLKARLAADLYQ